MQLPRRGAPACAPSFPSHPRPSGELDVEWGALHVQPAGRIAREHGTDHFALKEGIEAWRGDSCTVPVSVLTGEREAEDDD